MHLVFLCLLCHAAAFIGYDGRAYDPPHRHKLHHLRRHRAVHLLNARPHRRGEAIVRKIPPDLVHSFVLGSSRLQEGPMQALHVLCAEKGWKNRTEFSACKREVETKRCAPQNATAAAPHAAVVSASKGKLPTDPHQRLPAQNSSSETFSKEWCNQWWANLTAAISSPHHLRFNNAAAKEEEKKDETNNKKVERNAEKNDETTDVKTHENVENDEKGDEKTDEKKDDNDDEKDDEEKDEKKDEKEDEKEGEKKADNDDEKDAEEEDEKKDEKKDDTEDQEGDQKEEEKDDEKEQEDTEDGLSDLPWIGEAEAFKRGGAFDNTQCATPRFPQGGQVCISSDAERDPPSCYKGYRVVPLGGGRYTCWTDEAPGLRLPEQGFSGTNAEHVDGETWTSDFGVEYGPRAKHGARSYDEAAAVACKRKLTTWCVRNGFGREDEDEVDAANEPPPQPKPKKSQAYRTDKLQLVLSAFLGAAILLPII